MNPVDATHIIVSRGLPDAGQAQRLLDDLPAAEWQWIQRLHRTQDRLRSLTGRALVRRMLATRLRPGRGGTARKPADIPLTTGPLGKPILAVGACHFNIAHSGDLIIAAVGPHAVGVDVEHCGGPVDAALWQTVTGRDSGAPEAFCTEWVCREAVLKACGLGLSAEPGRLHLHAPEQGWRRVSGLPEANGLWVRPLWESSAHCAALCLPGAPIPPGKPTPPPHETDAPPGPPRPETWQVSTLLLADWLDCRGDISYTIRI